MWVSAFDHKNGRAHSVPLNQAALEILERRQGDHPTHVFTYKGKPVVQDNTSAWWNVLQLAAVHDFRWHDLGHIFAIWHREVGIPTHELQRLGGLNTQSMVERYAHVASDGLQNAANRLNSLFKANLNL